MPNYNKLAKATNFEKSCAPVLAKSRIVVAWGLVWASVGSYETCVKYCMERKQFGKPIAQF